MNTRVMLALRIGKEEVDGVSIGPFVVHRMDNRWVDCSDINHKWGVTHASTGYSASYGPTKACTEHAARRLRDVGVDWNFTDPNTVKTFPKAQINKIRVIRVACAQGGFA